MCATENDCDRSGGMQAPHDAFFRRVFARPKRLAGLLRAVLPPEVAAGLVLDALEMASPIRVDEALKGQVSDLVCRVPVQGGGETLVVDFLPEHQTRVWPFLRREPEDRSSQRAERSRFRPKVYPRYIEAEIGEHQSGGREGPGAAGEMGQT